MADTEGIKEPRLDIEVGKTKLTLYVEQSVSSSIPAVWINSSQGDIAVAYNRSETISGQNVEYAPPTDEERIAFDLPTDITFHVFTNEDQARAVAEQKLEGSAINNYIAMHGGGWYGISEGSRTTPAIYLDSSNFEEIPSSISHGIYQNGKAITPKIKGTDVSRVMYNGKQIYPTVTFEPYTLQNVPNGVYIIDTDNLLYPRANWDTANNANAMGVAVISDNCRFVISKVQGERMEWGGYGTLINDIVTTTDPDAAKLDYDGEGNTDKIIAQLGAENAPAANYCKNTDGLFPDGRHGYLPSLGEWNEAYNNKAEVDACMSLIDGDAIITNYYYWSSTQYSAIVSRLLAWSSGIVSTGSKNSTAPVRAFLSLKTSFTPDEAPNGVYVYSTDEKLYKPEYWDAANNENAVGVAVIADSCRFAISKVQGGNMEWGGNGIVINDIVTTTNANTAKMDYDGKGNTDKIIAQLGAGNAPAANYCKNTDGLFPDGRQGYLGSLGEWQEAYNNKSEVDACMSLIGGAAIATDSTHWTSTQYSLSMAWLLRWRDGFVDDYGKFRTFRVRAFLSLKTSYTLDEAPNGVYVLSTDNMLYKKGGWDVANNANAVGVAVLSDDCKFVISKQEASGRMIWGSTGTPSGCFMSSDSSAALQDFAGKANTDAVLSAYESEATAANYCRNTSGLFPDGRQGYLPSLGEWKTAYDNKTEVAACMSLIGGTAFQENWYWSSSLYSSDNAWILYWNTGYVDSDLRDNEINYVRAVASLDPVSYTPETAPNGVYICTNEGKLYPKADWNQDNNDNSVGVAIVTDNVRLLIKKGIEAKSNIPWSSALDGVDLPEISNGDNADYNGMNNSAAIRQAAPSENDTNNAAWYCYSQTISVNSKNINGYLPAIGELLDIYGNKSDIEDALTLIGSQTITESCGFGNDLYLYSSSEASASYMTMLYWNDGSSIDAPKGGSGGNTSILPIFPLSLPLNIYTPETAPNGVYVYSTDGKLYKQDAWDTANNDNAVGVGVVADECKFVISKQEASNAMIWGSEGTPAGCFMSTDQIAALQDFAGKENTDAVLDAYGTEATAADYCRNTSGLFPVVMQGYLPSLGEWKKMYDNKSEVTACMSLIGGTAFTGSYYWSSSLYSSNRAWILNWNYGIVSYTGRASNDGSVRAIAPMS